MIRPPALGSHLRAGFTLVEVIAAISIAAVVLALSVPAMGKLYQSMQYRQAVRDTITILTSARREAINSGRLQDVAVDPKKRQIAFNGDLTSLPQDMLVIVNSARQLNEGDIGVIRFYPEGGSSGGSVDIENPGAYGVSIHVDWLMGGISQEKYAIR